MIRAVALVLCAGVLNPHSLKAEGNVGVNWKLAQVVQTANHPKVKRYSAETFFAKEVGVLNGAAKHQAANPSVHTIKDFQRNGIAYRSKSICRADLLPLKFIESAAFCRKIGQSVIQSISDRANNICNTFFCRRLPKVSIREHEDKAPRRSDMAAGVVRPGPPYRSLKVDVGSKLLIADFARRFDGGVSCRAGPRGLIQCSLDEVDTDNRDTNTQEGNPSHQIRGSRHSGLGLKVALAALVTLCGFYYFIRALAQSGSTKTKTLNGYALLGAFLIPAGGILLALLFGGA